MVVAFGICITKSINLKKITKNNGFATGNRTMVHSNTKINMYNLGWCPLQKRRAKVKVTLLYKIIHDLAIIDKTDLIPTNSPRRAFYFFVPRSEKDVHLHSFFPSTILLWNSLPLVTKNSLTLSSFKEAVDQNTIISAY